MNRPNNTPDAMKSIIFIIPLSTWTALICCSCSRYIHLIYILECQHLAWCSSKKNCVFLYQYNYYILRVPTHMHFWFHVDFSTLNVWIGHCNLKKIRRNTKAWTILMNLSYSWDTMYVSDSNPYSGVELNSWMFQPGVNITAPKRSLYGDVTHKYITPSLISFKSTMYFPQPLSLGT